jgi:hypothetical protein
MMRAAISAGQARSSGSEIARIGVETLYRIGTFGVPVPEPTPFWIGTVRFGGIFSLCIGIALLMLAVFVRLQRG